MQQFLYRLLQNKTILISLLAWIIAQALKFIIHYLKKGKLDFRVLTTSGGMPSAHAAMTTSLAVLVGRNSGWDSTVFAVALILAGVVMYDAAGVRRAAGKQAEVLNKVIEDIYKESKFSPKRLKELLGHTPIEVIAGSALGLLLGIIF